ncbi:hypothetical protein H0H92_014721 [Tricholoma furcatifolium]|nr:hypothetical protein H0H92_014721 [Tricholoma furcatifolium]
MVTRDLKLCFAASGDIRNLIRTVNGLPENYSGRCDILFNDWNALVVGHNVVVLWALLNPDLTIDIAAEFALHLMYSSLLTVEMSEFLSSKGITNLLRDLTNGQRTSISIRGKGKLHVMLDPDSGLGGTIRMLGTTYGYRAAVNAYTKIMCNILRQDYTDRHLNNLEPTHRLAFSRYRASGILAPFSLDVSHFVEPNRLLFSQHGEWLLPDSASPIDGWDMSLVFAYAERNRLKRADSYGCLFFYLKNELSIFAKRLRDFRVNITLTMLDATQALPNRIASATALPSFSFGCFDRIETSNLADYITAPRILSAWAPFLNRDDKFATILIYFMNWQKNYFLTPGLGNSEKPQMQKYASIMGIDMQSALMSGVFAKGPSISPLMTRFCSGIESFTDDHEKFQSFLRDQCIEKAAGACGLQLRKINRIHPKRAGAALSASCLTIPDGLTTSEYYNTLGFGSQSSLEDLNQQRVLSSLKRAIKISCHFLIDL